MNMVTDLGMKRGGIGESSCYFKFDMKASDFEVINEAHPSDDSGGCGFIPEDMVRNPFGFGMISGSPHYVVPLPLMDDSQV